MSGSSKANQRQGRTRKAGYTKYKNEDRYTKNKVVKLLRHMRRFPMDTRTHGVLVKYGKVINKNYETLDFKQKAAA
jgi:hypothetical protein